MRGVDHLPSGLAAGLAYSTLVAHYGPRETAIVTALCGATVMLPDSDQRCSSAGRSLGFLSSAVCWVIGKVSGGHRHLTHSLLGVAAFTAWAWAGGHWRGTWEGKAALLILLAIAIAAAFGAVGAKGHIGDAVAIAAAVGVAWYGPALALVPLATAIGCLAHLAGDALTVDGVPLLLPLSRFEFRLPWPLAFRTGTWRETWVVRPLLLVTFGLLAWHAVAVSSTGRWPLL